MFLFFILASCNNFFFYDLFSCIVLFLSWQPPTIYFLGFVLFWFDISYCFCVYSIVIVGPINHQLEDWWKLSFCKCFHRLCQASRWTNNQSTCAIEYLSPVQNRIQSIQWFNCWCAATTFKVFFSMLHSAILLHYWSRHWWILFTS